MAQPTALDQHMLELINQARANPSAAASKLGIGLNDGLSSGTISSTPKQPLAFNEDIIDAAHKHSVWMLETDTFSHTGAGGSSAGARMKAEGYTGSSWGENISITWGSGKVPSQSVVESMENGLFKSPGHRTNILKDSYNEIGIGVEGGEYKGSPGVTATQNFGKSASPYLTGVSFDDKDGDNFYDVGEGLAGVKIQAQSSTGQSYSVTGWDAGGWQIAVPQGSYTLTFSGGGLAAPVTKTATVGASNVKVDLNADAPGGGTPTPSPQPPSPEQPAPAPEGVSKTGTYRNETISGTEGNDTLSGRGGNDSLNGYGGNDVLIGGTSSDALKGGTGADTFVYTGLSDRSDSITDFNGAAGDKIDVSEILDDYDYTGSNPFADGTLDFTDTWRGERLDVEIGGREVTGLFTLVGVHQQPTPDMFIL